MTNLPEWLQRRRPAVAYYSRYSPPMAEAWPVTYHFTPTGARISATDEFGAEIWFRAATLEATQELMGSRSGHCLLIPADDPRVAEAAERTAVVRIARELVALIAANRPNRVLSTGELVDRIATIRDAAAVAYDDITSLVAKRP